MAQEVRELELGGYTYRVTQLGARKAAEVLERLVKLVAPGTRGFADSVAVAQTLDALAMMGLPAAVATVLDELKVGTTMEVAEIFAPFTNVREDERTDGPGPRLDKVFDQHFAGKLSHLYRWLVFCVEVNYSDFFDESGPMAPVLEKIKGLFRSRSLEPSESESPPGSAG